VKIIVFAHHLEVGGTQVNAIELSAALRDLHGHDVTLFATPGPMVDLVYKNKLSYFPAPGCKIHPSPARMTALRKVIKNVKPDVIHVWDWWQCLDSYYLAYLLMGVPMLVTDMCMALSGVLPRKLPTTFGTPELVDKAKAAGHSDVGLILPPVDISKNSPGQGDPTHFLKRFNIKPDEITLVTVSRLAPSMKSDSLRRTIKAIGVLGRALPLRFIVVGDGNARPELETMAADINKSLGREAVVFTGAMLDPRPAYEAADVVVGMGGSSLRAMAFAKPVIIVGENGFSAPFNNETMSSFYYKGMYGFGNGEGNPLVEQIRALTENRDELPALGEFSRQFVLKHFTFENVSSKLSDFCTSAASSSPRISSAAFDACRTTLICLRERRFLQGRVKVASSEPV
jgi:glycosyltransferase involved in cell wall biosynthesis